jgi:hypothetical protein
MSKYIENKIKLSNKGVGPTTPKIWHRVPFFQYYGQM